MHSYYLARSKQGHDAGEVYMVMGEENGRLICVNGRNKTLDKPKRKNPAHMQPIFKGEWRSVLSETPDDCCIKRCIRIYLKSEDPKEEA
ncbi:MAG: KOW domain-containing RNA-binding protein [Eubacteriales bacterium]|nr:KOW domain-containing RNA-binding protein [Eubacteriales bacterium]